MASENESARKVLGAAVQELVDAYGGVRGLARRLGEEKTYAGQVSKWRRGQDIGLSTMSLIAERLDRPITFTFEPSGVLRVTQNEPPPDWARALPEKVVDEILMRLGSSDAVDRFAALLKESGLLPGGESDAGSGAPLGASDTDPQ